MHFVYIDDSGDPGKTSGFSALAVPVDSWRDCIEILKDFRRGLRAKHGIFVKKELHATDFVAGRGRISPGIVTKSQRAAIFRDTLKMAAGLPNVRLFNAFDIESKQAKIFERLLNRINTTIEKTLVSKAVIISDRGKEGQYTKLLRKMKVFNPVPSKYGYWETGAVTKNLTLDAILEDIVYRDSRESYMIQLMDFCAYALLRNQVPIPKKSKYGLDRAFDELKPIIQPGVFWKDPDNIIRG